MKTLEGRLMWLSDGKISPFVEEFIEETRYMTDTEMAFFYGQLAHESGNFRYISENLNYSSKALLSVFGKYFDSDGAEEYARNQEMIANRVYANRMGNGDEESGDGWKYRGGGLIQITGKNNYSKLAEDLGVDFDNITEYVRTPEGAIRSALWFWESNNLGKLINGYNIHQITRRINGGYHGLDDRIEKTANALKELCGILSRSNNVNDNAIKHLQFAINTKFGEELSIDGDFGPMTERVCKKVLGNLVVGKNEYHKILKIKC